MQFIVQNIHGTGYQVVTNPYNQGIILHYLSKCQHTISYYFLTIHQSKPDKPKILIFHPVHSAIRSSGHPDLVENGNPITIVLVQKNRVWQNVEMKIYFNPGFLLYSFYLIATGWYVEFGE